jgi:hypothetical protein
MGAKDVVQVPIVNHCSAFEGKVEKSNLASDGESVWRKFGNVKSTGRTGFENQIVGSIVVLELPDIPRFKPERAEAANVAKGTGGRRTDCDCNPCDLVLGVIEVQVHHKLTGGWTIENLGAFKDPVFADVLRVGELKRAPAEGPMNEVPGGVAGDVSLIW